eukprot:TRINITY_DN14300_c0_g1_i1.p1 TRINITY_DN14300_c0_g1~~TRINITY_DN14300_c0_g1_i1.p1  ORF type:complete len:479 (-),score=68.38 TRINITY_DN14300_c0_g1_i1:89-1414(-)
MQSCAPIVTASFRVKLLGTHLENGTEAVDVFSTTNGIMLYLTAMLIFYTSGMMGQVTRHLTLHEYEMIGKRITVSYAIGLGWSVFLVAALYGLQGPLLDFYETPPRIRVQVEPFYLRYLSVIPMLTWYTINSAFVIGLKNLILQLVLTVLSSVTEMAVLYAMLKYMPEMGVYNVLYATLVTVGFISLLQVCWIFQPKHLKKFRLGKKEAWNWKDKAFRAVFVVESGWMFGRGALEMGQYFFTPIFVSRIGSIQFGTFSVQNLLFFFTALLSDSVGKACMLKGAEYLAKQRYDYWRKLVFWSQAVIGVANLLICAAFWVGKEYIFHSFTNDPQVYMEAMESFPYWFIAIVAGGLPGVCEGLVMAKQKWDLLFYSIVLAIIFWLVLSLLNILWLEYLPLIWVSLALFMYGRWLPVWIVLIVETIRERKTHEASIVTESATLIN